MHSLKDWCAEKYALTDQRGCMCGACMRCLHLAGVISAMPGTWPPPGVLMPGMPQLHPDDAPHAGGHFDDAYYDEDHDNDLYDDEYDVEYDEEEQGHAYFHGAGGYDDFY